MRRSDLRVKKRSRRVSSPFLVYAFRSIDDICELARRLETRYSGESTLYRCKDSYYLILSKSGLHSYSIKLFELTLSEYGVKVPNINFMEGYLNEHGEKIIESNALEVLRKYY